MLRDQPGVTEDPPAIPSGMGELDAPYLELAAVAGMSPSRLQVTTAVECLGPRERSR